ncbi:MAG: AAA family ATPase [Oscillospiraceae bacterium]|nr:AAA family ATPase [Oscillospiraceae bacterium]
MKCGLLGRTLGHSYSPQIHSYLGDYPYTLFEKEPEDVGSFLKNGDFTAINVTIPYKKDVMPYCAELTDCAKKMGAVNTIVRRTDGALIGHNTDYFGLHYTFNRMGLSLTGKKVLVLGSGGASVTTVIVLKELGANVVIISRTGENNYTNLHLHRDAAVIVNTTPVGMYPNAGVSPVDLDMFPSLEGVLDIIYNPARTKLLLDAAERNIPCENGLWMLVAQAKEAAEWFTGTKISDDVIPEIYDKMCKRMENIVLIGMPGCGKSTIGKLLAQELNREFIDADAEIVNEAGMSIPEIFETQGEEGFRKIEMQVLTKLGQKSCLVIATGGGCVTKAENYPLLHQNGTIYWIKRDIASLPTDGRPLSQAGKLEQMYKVRKPLYEQFADCAVSNDNCPGDAVAKILKGRNDK